MSVNGVKVGISKPGGIYMKIITPEDYALYQEYKSYGTKNYVRRRELRILLQEIFTMEDLRLNWKYYGKAEC